MTPRHGRRLEETTLTVWQVVELARHANRPYSLDYIRRLAPDFIQLHGDRLSADDPAPVGGGALGMGVADRVIMLENSIYSVASPEAAASIVWRDNSRKVEAAEQLQLTSRDLLAMGVVEEVVAEPDGGAHLDFDATARSLDEALDRHMQPLLAQQAPDLLQHRYQRFRYIDSLVHAEPHFVPKID